MRITKFTKLDDIELPNSWEDEDYHGAAVELDECDKDLEEKEVEFIADCLESNKQFTERQQQWIYKLYKVYCQ